MTNLKQERNLVVTTDRICNFAGKTLKRAIEVDELAGLTKSTTKDDFQFIIHVKNGYDYQFDLPHLVSVVRDQTFEAIKEVYIYQTGNNLPIYGVPTSGENSQIQAFVQTERDFRKGIERMPSQKYRLNEEDIRDYSQETENIKLKKKRKVRDKENVHENVRVGSIPVHDV